MNAITANNSPPNIFPGIIHPRRKANNVAAIQIRIYSVSVIGQYALESFTCSSSDDRLLKYSLIQPLNISISDFDLTLFLGDGVLSLSYWGMSTKRAILSCFFERGPFLKSQIPIKMIPATQMRNKKNIINVITFGSSDFMIRICSLSSAVYFDKSTSAYCASYYAAYYFLIIISSSLTISLIALLMG